MRAAAPTHPPGPSSRADGSARIAFAIYPAFVLAFAVFALYQSITERFPSLYFDEWHNLIAREKYPFFSWLILPHNGHLIPATRLLLHLDYEYLQGRNDLALVVAFACTGISVLSLNGALRRLDSLAVGVRITLVAFFGFCLLWSGLLYGYFWGFAVHAPMTVAGVTLSLASMLVAASREQNDSQDSSRGPLLVALGAAVTASFSSASGVGIWPALLSISIATRLSWRFSAAIVAVAVVVVVVLLLAIQGAPPMKSSSSFDLAVASLQHPTRLLSFVLSFVGFPAELIVAGAIDLDLKQAQSVAVALGGLILVVASAIAARALRRRSLRDQGVISVLCLSLAAYAISVAFLAGLARSWLVNTATHARFVPYAVLLWFGCVAGLLALRTSRTSTTTGTFASMAAAAAISLAMVPALEAPLRLHRAIRRAVEKQSLMILAGGRSAEEMRKHTWAEGTLELLPMLELDRRGPFADRRAIYLGAKLETIAHGAIGSCSGAVRRWETVGSMDAPAVKIAGAMRGGPTHDEVSTLLVTDERGEIRGLGNVVPSESGPIWNWYAYARYNGEDARYAVYAFLSDGTVCLIGHSSAHESPQSLEDSGPR